MDLKKTQKLLFGIFAFVGTGLMIGGVCTLIGPLITGNFSMINLFPAFMMMFMGAIFGLVGWIPLINIKKNDKKHQYLMQNGRILEAKIESIYLDTSMSVNGYNPYVVTCIYKDEFTGQEFRFKSHRIWDGSIGMAQVGGNIKVHVDPVNYHEYYVNPESALAEISYNNNIIDM
ncbi:MAG: hypothetical protein IJZ25_03955 [Lachnospiraceae bacterium]|nr:hypothetical protein [Lachnospiraceae bacterium]